MPSQLKLHSSVNSTCAAKSGCTANHWRNHHEKSTVADGWLLSRHDHTACDRVEGLWLPTLTKPSCGSHLHACIQLVSLRRQCKHSNFLHSASILKEIIPCTIAGPPEHSHLQCRK
ncbi:hypothetical protein TNCV_4415941 [Trichonephila clavipes]|uniref:Uncharacterized protein n=1 Tax=Trichonephila clavipes TaxID=2585209 RepID=A0A8X6VE32_TRICX|nr:hypothetical protein TNCV_4415941 [Trichonephila clavipes]